MNAQIRHFLKELEGFEYELSSLDHVWHILFPDKACNWHHLHINKYEKTFYMSCHDMENGVIEVPPRGPVGMMDTHAGSSFRPPPSEEVWSKLISDAHAWLQIVRRNWTKAARRVVSEYPLAYRQGIVSHSVVRNALTDLYRLDHDLGIRKSRKIVRLVEEGDIRGGTNTVAATMTANRYFEYCRIAYIAGDDKHEPVDASLSGREMYQQHADGRHAGLLAIGPDSESAFANWIDGKDPGKSPYGGHPWEIRRGGNTTHINLYVSRPSFGISEGFSMILCGESFTRMAETIRMFLAIHAAGLPISIANPEAVRKRILGQDNLGIVPAYDSLHRANQRFQKEQHVYDVLYLKAFGRFKKRIMPFITWEPLPLLRSLK
jgi:hypothetical protein